MAEPIRQPFSMTLMPNAVSALLTVGGVELPDSRRFLDLAAVTTMSLQFKSSAGIAVQVDGSPDYGTTWITIIPADAYTGLNPYRTGWWPIPAALQQDDVLLRGMGIGAGLLVTVNYVEVQYR